MPRYLRWALLAVLILLSLCTGITKLIRLPAEMELFARAGFSDGMTVLFGVVQVLGGLLLLATKTRRAGALIMAVTFVIASGVVFASGMTAFGIVSLSFIALAAYFAARPGDPATHPVLP